MTLNKTFLAAVDPSSRAINNLSMSADQELRRLEERIKTLEATVVALAARLTAHGI